MTTTPVAPGIRPPGIVPEKWTGNGPDLTGSGPEADLDQKWTEVGQKWTEVDQK